MLARIFRNWIVVVLGVLALVLLVGAGTALATQAGKDVSSVITSTAPVKAVSSGERELVGVVKSFDQNKQTFTLLPVKQSKAITIAYDSRTKMEYGQGAIKLGVGSYYKVYVIARSDGSLYAREIEPVRGGSYGEHEEYEGHGDDGYSSGSYREDE